MPTAKATVTEVYAQQHQSKSVFRLGTRVTDKSKNPSWDNKTVHSGYIYEKLADAMADKNLFRWFYSSRGPEQPKKPPYVWNTNSPGIQIQNLQETVFFWRVFRERPA